MGTHPLSPRVRLAGRDAHVIDAVDSAAEGPVDQEAGATAAGAGIQHAGGAGDIAECLKDDGDLLGLHAVQLGSDRSLAVFGPGVEDGAVEVTDGEVVVIEAINLTQVQVQDVRALAVQ